MISNQLVIWPNNVIVLFSYDVASLTFSPILPSSPSTFHHSTASFLCVLISGINKNNFQASPNPKPFIGQASNSWQQISTNLQPSSHQELSTSQSGNWFTKYSKICFLLLCLFIRFLFFSPTLNWFFFLFKSLSSHFF